MKSLKVFLAFLLILNPLVYALEIEPPEAQPGDDEEVVVTVGEMRRALFYYEVSQMLLVELNDYIDYLSEVKEDIEELEKEAVSKLRLSEDLRAKEARRATFYQRTTLAFALTTVALAGIVLGR